MFLTYLRADFLAFSSFKPNKTSKASIRSFMSNDSTYRLIEYKKTQDFEAGAAQGNQVIKYP